MNSSTFWLTLRIVALFVMASAIWSVPSEHSNIGWGVGALFGAMIAVGLYVWLWVMRSRSGIDWTQPYSLKTAFLPVNKFPLRFWLLSGYGMVLGGCAAILRDYVHHTGREAIGGTFVVAGLFVVVALALWIQI